MKVVIVSDTHGDTSRLEKVFLREQDADIYLHAGDIEASEEAIAPFVGVRGNCDGFYPSHPFSRQIKTPYGLLRIEHRPIVSDAMLISLYNDGVRIFVHGHTHIKEERISHGILILCPGSLDYPRDEGDGSYLVLDIEESGVKSTFKEY